MGRIQKWIFFLVCLSVLTNGAFNLSLADHDELKGKKWFLKILDWNDDDDEYVHR